MLLHGMADYPRMEFWTALMLVKLTYVYKQPFSKHLCYIGIICYRQILCICEISSGRKWTMLFSYPAEYGTAENPQPE